MGNPAHPCNEAGHSKEISLVWQMGHRGPGREKKKRGHGWGNQGPSEKKGHGWGPRPEGRTVGQRAQGEVIWPKGQVNGVRRRARGKENGSEAQPGGQVMWPEGQVKGVWRRGRQEASKPGASDGAEGEAGSLQAWGR